MRKFIVLAALLVTACTSTVPPAPTPEIPAGYEPWGYKDMCANPERTPDSEIHCPKEQSST